MITVITGPPCSGKTTYARQHARPGDIIIDFDDIAQALGSPVRHGHADELARVAIAARSAAIKTAIDAGRRGVRAWIVDMAPTSARRRQYEQAGARIVTLTAGRDELHRRAGAERPPRWHNLIDQWLDSGGKPVPPPWLEPDSEPRPHGRTRW